MATNPIRQRYEYLAEHLNERQRRLWAAAEAQTLGRGGIAAVAEATGLSRGLISRDCRELHESRVRSAARGRVRRAGGGRKRAKQIDPTLRRDLERLVEPLSRGDPDSPLRWTCKNTRTLAAALRAQGHQIAHVRVAELLHELGYSLQANRKTQEEGTQHVDRNAQFEHLNARAEGYQAAGESMISVDTKKKEPIGHFKNAGQTWCLTGTPEAVKDRDFAEARAIPYGIYDLSANTGWVDVGEDHDTAAFAVVSIRRWWYGMGRHAYPQAQRLLISADAGGSNGYRLRAWK